MLPLAISFLGGCSIGILLIIISAFKWVFIFIFLINFGFLITVGCGMMFLCISLLIT